MHAAMIKRFVLLAVVSVVAACGTSGPVPENHFYRLEVPAPATAGTRLLDGILEVDRMLATGSLSQRSIVYRHKDNPHQLKAYHYHHWNEAPGILLQAAMVGYLRDAGVAEKVMTPEMRARPQYAVTGRVVKLERVIGGPPAGVIEMNFVLRRIADNTVMISKSYNRGVTPKDDSLTALVRALSDATGDIFQTFVRDIDQSK